jgi:plasmid stability protein
MMEASWRILGNSECQNVPEELYSRLKARAQREGRSIFEEVLHILDEATTPYETVSILELRGLGKETWKGIDPATHVDEERRSWD